MTTAPERLVSIVTPSLNQGQFLSQTLQSVRGQTYGNIEHIVVDGGSTDSSLDVLRDVEGQSDLRWLSESDLGMYDAINKGFRLAQGEILAYLNSDDLYLPWTIGAVVKAFAASPDADFIYGDALRLDEKDGSIRPFFQHPFDVDFMTSSGSLIQPAVFWRRRILESVGPFDAGLRFAADLDYWLRAARAGCKFHRLDEFLAIDRAHAASLSSSRFEEMGQEIVRIRSQYRDGNKPTIAGRLRGRARRELLARSLWLKFAAESRRAGSNRNWPNGQGHLLRPVSAPAAILGTLPWLGPSIQKNLRWRADPVALASRELAVPATTPDPIVTIVTPSFRHAKWIGETLRSVHEQSYRHIEHIVIDGGSDDGTVEILAAAQQETGLRWVSEPDQGQADAINKGVRMATGDIVTWLNSDDVYVDRDAIARVVAKFQAGSVAVTGPGVRLNGNGSTRGPIRVYPDRLDASTLRHVDWLLQPSTFYTRELAVRYPLDPTLRFAMDWDLFIRLSQVATIDVVTEPIGGYRVHDTGKTVIGGADRQRELLRVLERYHSAGAWNVRLMRVIVRSYEFAERLPARPAWVVSRSLNAFARLTNVLTNGRGLPP